jgi:hypothetical protein
VSAVVGAGAAAPGSSRVGSRDSAPQRSTLARGGQRSSFEGDLSTYYLTLANARYFVAQLLGPGDAFREPVLPKLYEPVLTSIGNGVLVLRGFEREGETATVQEWRCDVVR